jgi:hypothetical protein
LEERLETGATGGVRATTYLFLVLEGFRLSARGARIDLSKVTQVSVGRADRRIIALGADGSLALGIPSPSMSGDHARIVREGARFFIEDRGSRNGTFVDGARVERAELRNGQLVELGRTYFLFRTDLLAYDGDPSVVDLDLVDNDAEHEGALTLLPDGARALGRLARVASSGASVLVLGPSGTGKELAARMVHRTSGRAGAFVAVNCGALPASLAEGLLFGHVRGAFSGAVRDEPGLVRSAHRGTLFLDEVADLRPDVQATLLRVLEQREVLPVGATRPVSVDFGVVSATHRPLQALVAAGQFRQDLFARLSGFVHVLSPLEKRREDLGTIISSIVRGLRRESLPSLSRNAASQLFEHPWPLNVRELRQALISALALASDAVIEEIPVTTPADDEPPSTSATRPPSSQDAPEVLQQRLDELLREHRGNVAAVARTMGKGVTQIRRWMARFEMAPDSYRDRDAG